MAKGWRQGCQKWTWVLLGAGGALVSSVNLATAQVVPDTSLPQNSAVTAVGNNFTITGGTAVQNNLFHSFSQFSVPTLGEAFFNNASGVQNIINRVTGSSASNIDGILRANGTANLFLLNPNGIIFGPNASLNVGGSFVSSTFESLVWSNGSQFSATNPGDSSNLLTLVGDPSGFLSNLRPPQPITSSGSTLRVPGGQSLLLLGGNITLDNSNLFVDSAQGGRIELASIADTGSVGLEISGNILSLNIPDGLARTDISLQNDTDVELLTENGGSIAITARNLDILGQSNVEANIEEGRGTLTSQAGDITLNATGAIRLADFSLVESDVEEGATGIGGNVNVTAESLSLTGGSQLSARVLGNGDAGNINISVRDRIAFDGETTTPNGVISSGAYTTVEPRAVGNGGDVNMTTRSLSLTNGALVTAYTFGQGNAGDVIINAGSISFDGIRSDGFSSGAYSSVQEETAIGNGGNISVTADSLSVTNGALVTAYTFGQGNAGNVTINAENITFDGTRSNDGFSSGPYSSVQVTGVGDGGSISITAGSLSTTNGGRVSASVFGRGNAGKVELRVRDTIDLAGVSPDGQSPSGLRSAIEPEGVGNGGTVTFETNRLVVRDGAQISTATLGTGNAGDVNLLADSIELTGTSDNGQFPSGIQSAVELGSVGDGGDVNITTNRLAVQNGAEISASNSGPGRPGNITATARLILLENQGSLTAESQIGSGGNITLNTQDLALLRNSSEISAISGGLGEAGDISINDGFLVALENSNVIANAATLGANIDLNTQGVFFSQNSSIILNGTEIEVIPPIEAVIDPSTVVTVDASQLIDTSCSPVANAKESELFVTGRGGIPPSPDEPLTSDVVWSDTRLANIRSERSAVRNQEHPKASVVNHSQSQPPKIIPATGWVFNDKGEVTLISHASTATSERSTTATSCMQHK